MIGTRTNERSGSPTTRRLSGSSAFRLWTLLVVVIVVGAGAIYEAGRCSGPLAGRPVFGDFTIRCEWHDRTVRSLNIHDLLTDRRPRLDPISRALIKRLALTAARQELNHLGTVETRAEIDIRVFGHVLPFGVAVLATEFTNPSAPNFKPRLLEQRPPIHPGAYAQ